MSKNNESVSSSGGVGTLGLLTIVFVVLKLCKVISCSWRWVLSPLWISTGITLMIYAIIFVVILIKTQKNIRRIKKTNYN